MAVKQYQGSNSAPDGSQYVTLTDGAGNLAVVNTGGVAPAITTTGADAVSNTGIQASNTTAFNLIFGGTTWDRVRSLSGYSQTNSTGVQVAANAPHTSNLVGLPAQATTTANSAQVVKASACNLYSVSCNAGASAGFLLVFDATAAPADGAVTPIDCIPVAANAYVTKAYNIPLRCSTGATIVFSTTGPFTKTASATAFLMGQAV